MQRRAWLPQMTERGVEYWGAMYIPVVVAMAAQQDVVAALRGGPVALLAALGSLVSVRGCISLINRMEGPAQAIAPPAGRNPAKEHIMLEIFEKAPSTMAW